MPTPPPKRKPLENKFMELSGGKAPNILVLKQENLPKCSSSDKWLHKVCSRHIMEYYPAIKLKGLERWLSG